MTKKSDKRQFKRVDYTIQAVLELDGSSQVYLETRDINMRGIFVETESPLPVGAKGRLTIHLQCGNQREDVHAAFKVVRSQKATDEQPSGMGVEFTDIDSESSITLFNIVKFHGGFENI